MATPKQTTTIYLRTIPKEVPQNSDFEFVQEPISLLDNEQILIESEYFSVDPYIRGRITEWYNKPVTTYGIGIVISSKHSKFVKGDRIIGLIPWSKYIILTPNTQQIKKLPNTNQNISPSYYLGILGGTGLTAYYGLIHVGKLKNNENVLISGAAGAVGVIAGQISKIKGCYVVGTCGSNDKINYLTQELKFDHAINYKDYNNNKNLMKKKLTQLFPNGIDVYFDNTGGFVTEAIWDLLNKNARVVVCGQIANYNTIKNIPKIDDFLFKTIYKSIRIEGFAVYDYKERKDFYDNMMEWITKKQIENKETIIYGFEQIPKAFIGLFSGDNVGKMVVNVKSLSKL